MKNIKQIYFKATIYMYSCFGLPLLSFSQYNQVIQTGRPGQSIGAATVGTKILQFQNGVDYSVFETDLIRQRTFLSDHVIRYGINNRFEVNALIGTQHDEIYYRYTKDDYYDYGGLSQLQFGFRYSILCSEKKYYPHLGIQARFKLPYQSFHYKSDFIAPKFTLVLVQEIFAGISLASNLILDYNGSSAQPSWNYTLNFSKQFCNKYLLFVENYGPLNTGIKNTFIDAGFAFLASSSLQFDLYSGLNLTNENQYFFTSVGISWRIDFMKNRITE